MNGFNFDSLLLQILVYVRKNNLEPWLLLKFGMTMVALVTLSSVWSYVLAK